MSEPFHECPKCSEELCKYGKCHHCDTCDEHAEQAYERWIESYYGGDSPVTAREQAVADYRKFKQ